MYKVFKRESEFFLKETFTIWYEVDFDGDNTEWRVCVKDIIERFSTNHSIVEVGVPKFLAGEDFVKLKYMIDNEPIEFSCDFLLYSIFVTTNKVSLTESLRDTLGNQVGWK